MTITPRLFEAFLKCPTKCWLRSVNENPSGNAYAEWVQNQNESFRTDAIKRLTANRSAEECAVAPAAESLKSAKWQWAMDVPVRNDPRSSRGNEALTSSSPPETSSATPTDQSLLLRNSKCKRLWFQHLTMEFLSHLPSERWWELTSAATSIESRLHAVERVPSEGRGKAAQFVLIRFIFRNKLTPVDKLLLAFDALVLSEMLGRDVRLGKIIHGDDHATLKVKTSAMAGQVRKRLGKISALLSNPAPPDLVLIRHCAECEFQARCRKIAVEKDDLSLLARMSEKERKEFRSKGIFTVTQLSYTFRPRRRPKKLRDKRERYHHALKALAIREKKIHIVGRPELKIEGTPVYLDVEGLPDRDFYYLIGARIGNGDSAVQHSLWADTIGDEGKIWREFLAILETIEKPVLIHYGSYETTFLNEMGERHGSPPNESPQACAIQKSVNLISVLFAQIYFPTYSNSLKDIAGWLGFNWSALRPSGVQTISWRHKWERSKETTVMQHLITYNSEDCTACELVSKTILRSCPGNGTTNPGDETSLEIAFADSIASRETMWPRFSSTIEGFEAINKAARWNYQRDRVFVRTDKLLKRAAKAKETRTKRMVRFNKEVTCERVRTCPLCGGKPDRPLGQALTKVLYDIRFSRFGMRRWLVKYHFRVYRCRSCHKVFGTPEDFWPQSKYGRNLVSFVVFEIINLCSPQCTVAERLRRLFGLEMHLAVVNELKVRAAGCYAETRQRILLRMIKAKMVHADETSIVLKRGRGYVWVFATLREVVYFYADSREGDLPLKLLDGFKGVLVSDFYAAYDTMPCPQQKCLIHLMRDLNDSVLDHPYDEELKGIVTGFGGLLKDIVETIDRRGLKRHFLRKHIRDVERFYRKLARATCQSEAALKCKERFEKNREKLFTFLNRDGVPWNNNNAEHAIKAFARLRRAIEGLSTPKGIEEYLILLSICQTCKYVGVDFLDFLRSGEKDIHAFAESRRGRKRSSQASLPADAILKSVTPAPENEPSSPS